MAPSLGSLPGLYPAPSPVVPTVITDTSTLVDTSTDKLRNAILADGPIAYFPLSANATDTAFLDIVGGRIATIANLGTGVINAQNTIVPSVGRLSAEFVAASSGNAAVSAAEGVYLNTLLNGTNPFSIEFMVMPNVTRSGASTKYTVVSNWSSFIGLDLRIAWNSSLSQTTIDIDLAATTDSNAVRVTTNAVDLANGVPFHVVVTYDGSQTASGMKVYVGGQVVVNNVVANTLTNTISPSTYMTIGSTAANTQYFGGNIQDVAFYNYVLTPIQILTHAVSAAAGTQLPDLVGPIPVILDNDWGSDVDGICALYVAMRLQLQGKINILAIGCIDNELYTAPMVESILKWYGMNNIPIGVSNQSGSGNSSSYSNSVYTRFGTSIPGKTCANYPTTNSIYRTALSSAQNNSVVFASMGIPTNPYTLLTSSSDSISPLTGFDLYEQKVNRTYAIIAEYPNGGSSNGTTSPTTTSNWLNANPVSVPLIIDSHIAGATVYVGVNGANPFQNPLQYALNLWGAANPGVLQNGLRQAYDPLTTLEAGLGTGGGGFFKFPFVGKAIVNGSGLFTYTQNIQYQHRASVKSGSDTFLASTINALIVAMG